MHFHLDTFYQLVTLLAGFGMPYLISFVAHSSKKWLNLLISWGSSALLGVLSAWVGGKFTQDISVNLLLAIGAAEASYQLYWKPKTEAGIDVTPVASDETPAVE